jgi:hypothetical protein
VGVSAPQKKNLPRLGTSCKKGKQHNPDFAAGFQEPQKTQQTMSDPGKWLGLMKWSMQYNDGTHETKKTPMSEENKAFLEKVMKECVIDEVERMKQICEVLVGADPQEIFKDASEDIKGRLGGLETEEGVEKFHYDLLEYLQDLVENLDNANALKLIGGLPKLIDVYESKSGRIRMLAVSTLGACAQNNPICQDEFAVLGLLDKFLASLSDEDPKFRLKVLGSISSLIRGSAGLEAKFVAPPCNGIQMLCQLMNDADLRVKRKSLFLLRALIFSQKETATLARQHDAVPQLTGMIGNDDVDLRESCINALLELSAADQEVAKLVQDPSSPLRQALQARMEGLGKLAGEDAEMAQEELSLCEKLNELAMGKTIFSGIDQQLWVDRQTDEPGKYTLGPQKTEAGAAGAAVALHGPGKPAADAPGAAKEAGPQDDKLVAALAAAVRETEPVLLLDAPPLD